MEAILFAIIALLPGLAALEILRRQTAARQAEVAHQHDWTFVNSMWVPDGAGATVDSYHCPPCTAWMRLVRPGAQPHNHLWSKSGQVVGETEVVTEFACRFCGIQERRLDGDVPSHEHPLEAHEHPLVPHTHERDSQRTRHVHIWKQNSVEETNKTVRRVNVCADCQRREVREE
jgi:hypothetical protein